ncbi:MAG: polyribonucleotide nucleotidyltransferase [Candidatus Paceibacterota bacterium]
MKETTFEIEVGGKKLRAHFSDLAEQANGSVIISYGDTSILATATISDEERTSIDFFPLTVDYEERFYAAGEILGSRYMRREGRPSEEATLTGRVIDRTIRPLFPSHIRKEVQVVITVLSFGEDDPDVISLIGASLALGVSNIPWGGPLSGVRIGVKNEGGFIVNPSYKERVSGLLLEAIVCGKDGKINMIDAEAHEVNEEKMGETLKEASVEIEKLQVFQKKIIERIGNEKMLLSSETLSGEAKELFKKEVAPQLTNAVFNNKKGKKAISELEKEWLLLVEEILPETNRSRAREHYEEEVNKLLHEEAISHERRADGRGMDEIRPLYARVGGISNVIHGSGMFYRGGTHVLSMLTLAGPKSGQLVEGMEEQREKRYMHHYNFPPFSVGETGRIGGVNRRMIGHGALAEKALVPVLPSKESFPYTIRVVSEALASNGSTSMASVCGSTLALMDGGVPIKAPVAGMAMGLMYKDENNYKILTDIQGPEDHHGDMDFKVAGTREGITAVQMDVKIDAIPITILEESFVRAKEAREKVLDVIEKEITKPRESVSEKAPHITVLKIEPGQIGLVIGGGGKMINGIIEKTGTEIDIEDDGLVYIIGKGEGVEKAKEIIEQLTHVYQKGERFTGEVVKIVDFGAFVRISPYTEGLVHVSEMAPFRVEKVDELLKEGDRVPVVVKEIDEKGRIALSLKQADPLFFKDKQPKTS